MPLVRQIYVHALCVVSRMFQVSCVSLIGDSVRSGTNLERLLCVYMSVGELGGEVNSPPTLSPHFST